MRTLRILSICILTLIILGFFTQAKHCCRKPDPPKAIITVVDTGLIPVENATVRVYSPPNGSVISITKQTNSSGQAEFEFEHECILNVKAEKRVGGVTLEGKSLIILKNDETAEPLESPIKIK
jgi:hypothetical protein